MCCRFVLRFLLSNPSYSQGRILLNAHSPVYQLLHLYHITMFAKSFSSISVLAITLSLSLQALGHAIITPALGVTGIPVRADVTRVSDTAPCGSGVDIASVIPGSEAAQAAGNVFNVTITNFNGGEDGSTEIVKTLIDTTGTGASFDGGSATITVNGEEAPETTGSVQLSGILPDDTACAGGNDGASCLVAFATAGGFGNCVLISQA